MATHPDGGEEWELVDLSRQSPYYRVVKVRESRSGAEYWFYLYTPLGRNRLRIESDAHVCGTLKKGDVPISHVPRGAKRILRSAYAVARLVE